MTLRLVNFDIFNSSYLSLTISKTIEGTEKVTSARLFSFLKVNSKIYIQAPGCVKELDDLAKEFAENSDKRKTILIKAETFIENIESEEVNRLVQFN